MKAPPPCGRFSNYPTPAAGRMYAKHPLCFLFVRTEDAAYCGVKRDRCSTQICSLEGPSSQSFRRLLGHECPNTATVTAFSVVCGSFSYVCLPLNV